MTELEFLDTLLQDRISMLLDNRDRNSRKTEFKNHQKYLIKCSNWNMQQKHLSDMLNTDEPFLYQQGVFDGIWLMKFIDKI